MCNNGSTFLNSNFKIYERTTNNSLTIGLLKRPATCTYTRVCKKIIYHPLHTGRTVNGEMDELVCIGIKLSFVPP